MENKGDLVKLFDRDYLARLDNIKQWLEYDRHQQESVSQHSFKVSVFTMSLLEYLWTSDTQHAEVWLFKYQTLKLALMHDFDEAILRRDITHELKYNKYNGGEIRNVLDRFVDRQLTEEFGDESDVVKMFSKKDEFYDVMHAIVKVADWMALLYFLNRELAIGNRSWPLNLLPYCKDNYRKAVSTLQNTCCMMHICDTQHPLYVSVNDISDLKLNIV
nr:MAG TPA: putative hydrolases of HD superfamily [Caudoviricetes sp.]